MDAFSHDDFFISVIAVTVLRDCNQLHPSLESPSRRRVTLYPLVSSVEGFSLPLHHPNLTSHSPPRYGCPHERGQSHPPV